MEGNSTSGKKQASSAFELNKMEGKQHQVIAVPAPSPPPAPALTHTSEINSPTETYNGMVNAGVMKSKMPFFRMVVLSLQSGFYLGFGFTFCCCVLGLLGNTVYGAMAFPTGLLLIILTGSELFTGNTCTMFVSWVERKTTIWDYIRVCTISYIFNFIGSLIIVEFERAANVWVGRETWVTALAHKKLSNDWGVTLVRGILANWLVNLALFQAGCARDVIGKMVGAFLPIIAFVSIGFEHSIANQFLLPMAVSLDSSITVGKIVGSNLVPVTIGNWIGGFFFTGFVFSMSFGTTIPNFFLSISAKVNEKCAPCFEKCAAFFKKLLPRKKESESTVAISLPAV